MQRNEQESKCVKGLVGISLFKNKFTRNNRKDQKKYILNN